MNEFQPGQKVFSAHGTRGIVISRDLGLSPNFYWVVWSGETRANRVPTVSLRAEFPTPEIIQDACAVFDCPFEGAFEVSFPPFDVMIVRGVDEYNVALSIHDNSGNHRTIKEYRWAPDYRDDLALISDLLKWALKEMKDRDQRWSRDQLAEPGYMPAVDARPTQIGDLTFWTEYDPESGLTALMCDFSESEDPIKVREVKWGSPVNGNGVSLALRNADLVAGYRERIVDLDLNRYPVDED